MANATDPLAKSVRGADPQVRARTRRRDDFDAALAWCDAMTTWDARACD